MQYEKLAFLFRRVTAMKPVQALAEGKIALLAMAAARSILEEALFVDEIYTYFVNMTLKKDSVLVGSAAMTYFFFHLHADGIVLFHEASTWDEALHWRDTCLDLGAYPYILPDFDLTDKDSALCSE